MMKSKIIPVFMTGTLALVMASGVWAQDASADFADTGADTPSASTTDKTKADAVIPSTAKLSFHGDHEFEYHAPAFGKALDYGDKNNYTDTIKVPNFNNIFGVDYSSGEIKLKFEGKLKTVANSDDPTTTFTPLENYIAWSPAKYPVKMTFGWQDFSWGVADKRNPTDTLNSRDYTVGVNPDKIPALAADAIVYPADWISFEAVYIPYRAASKYPIDFESQTAGTLNTDFASLYQSLGGLTASVSSYESEYKANSGIPGARVNFFFTGLDLSFSYIYDWDQFYTPQVKMSSYSVYNYTNSVSLNRNRIHRFGANAKTTLDRFGIWLETAYNVEENNQDDNVRDNMLAWTAGFDFNYGPGSDFYANIQYVGEWIPTYEDGSLDKSKITDKAYMTEMTEKLMTQQLGLQTEGLLQGVTVNMKWPLNNATVTPTLTGAYTIPMFYDDSAEKRYGSLVLNPELDVMPVESFHIFIGSDLYYALVKLEGDDHITLDTTTDKIGVYTPNNNVYIKVQYKWNWDFNK